MLFLCLFFFSCLSACDLESNPQSFVLHTKQIHLEDYPHAFNPSIIRHEGRLLLSFREIIDPFVMEDGSSAGCSRIGLVWLNEDFEPEGSPQIMDLDPYYKRDEDGRLVQIGDKLYLVYSSNRNEVVTDGGFRVYAAELLWDGNQFLLGEEQAYLHFQGQSSKKREKNWVPFDYEGHLLLSYSLNPHRIFYPSSSYCETIALTHQPIDWSWGELRGGTPAVKIDEKRYLSFFHSSVWMTSIQSLGLRSLHYFMGAYTFSSQPPFEILEISPQPIVATGFYSGKAYPPYWKPVNVVFPCGFILNDKSIYISYGRQDHEMWVAKIAKNDLLSSLKRL